MGSIDINATSGELAADHMLDALEELGSVVPDDTLFLSAWMGVKEAAILWDYMYDKE